MSGTSQLIAACRRAERAIEKATRSGQGAHKTREAMMRELALWLTTYFACHKFARLRSLRLPWKRWDTELWQQSFRLACAMHLIGKHRLSPARVATRSGASRGDVAYAMKLLGRTGIDVRDLADQQDPTIGFEVAAQTEDLHIRLEARALEDILLAAAEGYLPTRGSKFTEVFGLCFGSSSRRIGPSKE